MILMRVMMSIIIIIVSLSLIRDTSQSAVSQSRGERISPASWSDNDLRSFLPSHPSSQTLESRLLTSSDPIELIIRKGDTLTQLLTNNQVPFHEALAIAHSIEHIYDLRNLQVGQYLWLWIVQQDSESTLSRLILEYDPFHLLIVTPDPGAEDRFITHLKQKVIDTQIVSKEIIIQTTFYQDAKKANLPSAIISNLLTLFENQIDFSRGVRVKDRFNILYKVFTTKEGRSPTFSNILRADAILKRQRIIAYQFQINMKNAGYYSPAGENLNTITIQRPIADAYIISSGYGMRTLFGITRMHRGIDFAAPTGTKVYAASDGIVSSLRHSSSYGLYLRIQHNQTWATAYAHLDRFAQGLKQGQHVRQGQVIGYVGSTGISTGPHLHFEVLQNNTQVNPLPLLGQTVAPTRLSGALLADFQKQMRDIDRLASQAVRITHNADSVP